MRHTDVIVAGAGPAGSTAALVLARQGFEVLVLDRAAFPRPKLCGGLLTWKSVRLLERLHGRTAADLIGQGLVDTVTDGFSLFHGGRPLSQGRLAYPFHLVRREAFDAWLLDTAQSAGARVLQGCEVQTCDPEGRVRSSHGSFMGRFVLGADGVNSVVRQCFSLPRERWRKNLAAAVEVTVPRDRSPRVTDRPELYAGVLRAGYGWVFPNSRGMVLGICGLRRRAENFREAFKTFLGHLGMTDADGFLRSHPVHGHPIPYGNALADPVRGNVLLAGDAGGYADPLLGEGIFYALLTGLYAGEALADALKRSAHPGPAYRERIRISVMPEMRGADRLRWMLFALNKMAPANLGRYFRMRGSALADMVHGVRSYDWGRKKRWDF